MKGVDLHIMASLSRAKASILPELRNTDFAVIESLSRGALQGNSGEEYINRLNNAPRRNRDLQPVAKALADQFSRDNSQGSLDLSEYKLINEYGYTKHYQVTEQNSKVVFDVIFYFYGGIISGWSAEPEKGSYEKYRGSII